MAHNGMFSVYGRMETQPGQRDAVAALIQEAVRAGGGASGLLAYSINAPLGEPDAIWVTELWTDKAAHDRTTSSEPVRAVSQRMAALLEGTPTGTYGHALHVQGHIAP